MIDIVKRREEDADSIRGGFGHLIVVSVETDGPRQRFPTFRFEDQITSFVAPVGKIVQNVAPMQLHATVIGVVVHRVEHDIQSTSTDNFIAIPVGVAQ